MLPEPEATVPAAANDSSAACSALTISLPVTPAAVMVVESCGVMRDHDHTVPSERTMWPLPPPVNPPCEPTRTLHGAAGVPAAPVFGRPSGLDAPAPR